MSPRGFTTISKISLGRSPVPSAVATKAPPLEPLKVRDAGKAVVVAASMWFSSGFLWFSYGFDVVFIGFDEVLMWFYKPIAYRWFVSYGFDVLKNLAKYLLDGFGTCEQPSEKKTLGGSSHRSQPVCDHTMRYRPCTTHKLGS
jgi:hypothetical protein